MLPEKIFNLIKDERNFLGDFKNYKIKINQSNNFERENLIGVYRIRRYTAEKNGNNKLSQEISKLIIGLENYSKKRLRFVSILGRKYYGIFYLSENWDKVIGYIDREIDENEFKEMDSLD